MTTAKDVAWTIRDWLSDHAEALDSAQIDATDLWQAMKDVCEEQSPAKQASSK